MKKKNEKRREKKWTNRGSICHFHEGEKAFLSITGQDL